MRVERRRPTPPEAVDRGFSVSRGPRAAAKPAAITGHMIGRNLNAIRYPWREAVLSVLPVCSEVILCECHSDDGTYEDMARMAAANGKIRIIRGRWGDRCEVLADLTNQCIAEVRTPYHLQIQADEVLHEASAAELLGLARSGIEAALVNYVHFVGDFETVFDFIYSKAVRFARTGSAWRSGGDACSLGGGRGAAAPTSVVYYHYGKVHVGREAAAAKKEYEFLKMFEHLGIGFPDPLAVKAYEQGWIDYTEVFPRAKAAGEFRPFCGTHPAVMAPYIEAAVRRGLEWRAAKVAR